MEGDEIGMVLWRATELRSKINNCIDKATRRDRDEDGEGNSCSQSLCGEAEPDDEAESLLSIREALESLEEQLGSLQALQQQQRYEREATLAEIDHSRKILLKKLKDYKGEDLEVIQEASAFASETVEHNDDLLLPPYPSRPPRLPALHNSYPSQFTSAHKFARNGVISGDAIDEDNKTQSHLDKRQAQSKARNSPTGVRLVISVAAKAVLTIVSVISVLSLAGFEPKLGRKGNQLKGVGLLQKGVAEDKNATVQCPPGKVLVMEDGEPRCLVKERVEIPFESIVTAPDISYGCG